MIFGRSISSAVFLNILAFFSRSFSRTLFHRIFVYFQGVCTVRNLRNISDVENRVREPVVANNATASTVAFIAPGPPNPPITQVLYVGVTWTGNGPYRSEVPAVSSHSLDTNNLFQIAETAVTTGTRMFVNSLARERYPINYVYGFTSEGFSYFLTSQMKQTTPSPFQSKLVSIYTYSYFFRENDFFAEFV